MAAKSTIRMDVTDGDMAKKLTGLKVGSTVGLHHRVKITKVHDRTEPDYDSPTVGLAEGKGKPQKRMITIEGDLMDCEHEPIKGYGGKSDNPPDKSNKKSTAARAVLAMK